VWKPVLILLLAPQVASASTASSADVFRPVLILLAVVTAAYLVTHLLSGWLSKRFGIVTGVEYMLLGVIVGPVFDVLDQATVAQFSPALVLGTGSLGLLAGLNVRLKRPTRRVVWRTALIVSACTFLMVGLVPLAVITYGFSPAVAQTYVPHLLCLGAVALVADPAPLRSLVAYFDASGGGTEIAAGTARVCSSLAVTVFGIVFCASKPSASSFGFEGFEQSQAFVFWLGLHIGLATILALMFAAFLLRDYEDDKLLTVVIGIVIFTSGVAFYIEVSPIFVNFLVGLTLATMIKGDQVERMLASVERPLYIVLFFFAGASLSFDGYWWAILFAPYLLLRFIGRALGGFLAKRLSHEVGTFPSMSAVLWAPGGLSVAMALNFIAVFGRLKLAPELYLLILLSILASEAIAFQSARRWVIDATDVALAKE
jgi:Kef-type K+ transport system membrane component KefB